MKNAKEQIVEFIVSHYQKEKEKWHYATRPEQLQRSRPSQRGGPAHWCLRARQVLKLTGGAQASATERERDEGEERLTGEARLSSLTLR